MKKRKYVFYEGPFQPLHIGYHQAMANLDILLKMPKLPNKIFPWLTKKEVLEWKKRTESLYKKLK